MLSDNQSISNPFKRSIQNRVTVIKNSNKKSNDVPVFSKRRALLIESLRKDMMKYYQQTL